MGNTELKKEGVKKRGLFLLTLVTGIFSLNFVQAFLGLGIATEDMLLVAFFIALFWIIYIAFKNFFKDSQGQPLKTTWVPALALALGATYGIWNSNFRLEDIFFDIGISTGFLNVIAPIIVLGFVIFLIVRMRFSRFLFLLAGGFFLSGIMGWVYETGWSIFIGVVLFGIGLIVRHKGKYLRRRREIKQAEREEKGKQRAQRRIERKQKKRDARRFRKKRKKAEKRIEKRTGRKEWARKFRRGKRFVENQKAKKERQEAREAARNAKAQRKAQKKQRKRKKWEKAMKKKEKAAKGSKGKGKIELYERTKSGRKKDRENDKWPGKFASLTKAEKKELRRRGAID